jgi:hypothetical protein
LIPFEIGPVCVLYLKPGGVLSILDLIMEDDTMAMVAVLVVFGKGMIRLFS